VNHTEFELWLDELVLAVADPYDNSEREAREMLVSEFDRLTARVVDLENEIALMRYAWPRSNNWEYKTAGRTQEEIG
jgi:hypothetical protein